MMDLTCHDCEVPRWAPEEVSKEPHGWCQTWLEWVKPGCEACHKIEPIEEEQKQ